MSNAMTRWQRILNGWRMLDRTDWMGLGAICAVGAAGLTAGALSDREWYIIGGGWFLFALEMYLILGVAIPHSYGRFEGGVNYKRADWFHYTEHLDPTSLDAKWHYQSARYWLRVAEEAGRSTASIQAAASIAQAHASLGSLAHRISTHVEHRSSRWPA